MNITRENGVMTLHGHSLIDIKNKYGTPLFVYDEALIRNQCRRFHTALQQSGLNYTISYASKAFTSIQLFKLMQEEIMGLDVVSEGELFTALTAQFNPGRIHFHGNNKTKREIQYAIEAGVEYFVIDALEEIERINDIANQQGKSVKAVLRVNPGVEAHTHEFIQTGQEDSKFGLSIKHGLALQGIQQIIASSNIEFHGIHFHIGSQIFESTGTIETIQIVIQWLKEHQINIKVLNIGGGFSIRYTSDDISYPIEDGIKSITETLIATCESHDYPIPEISLEPGRSIVGEAGMTLYEVGTIKSIPGINKYISIDGGMSDHIRTALYNAQYEVELVDREEHELETVTVAGKLCESGDIIARNISLPQSIKSGDTLCVKSTGAYHYSMASNYNQMLKPAVVFVSDKGVRKVIKRQSPDHLIANEIL
ncbi:diaminopimelate decarboxylase [Macrococcus capreoli]|uniref:diaminopimelate decarboxylase n=1 Tax=Macrococcus capreoli TaxID=2982690 RepID=UPI003EE4460E